MKTEKGSEALEKAASATPQPLLRKQVLHGKQRFRRYDTAASLLSVFIRRFLSGGGKNETRRRLHAPAVLF